MRGRRRRRRDSLIAAAVAAVVVTVAVVGFAAALSKHSVVSIVFHPSAGAPAPQAAAYDHFDFSVVWLGVHHQPPLAIHGKAAFLVDVDSRVVLWARDPETARAPASLTKLMTAIVAMDDAGSLDKVVVVDPEATMIEPSLMGLSAGERLTVRDLMYGLFLDSGNDAAEALARGIVPRDRFIRQMNQKAKSIGLTEAHFVNPSGLDAPGHAMSAHDIVHLAAYLDRYYPQLAAIAATREMSIAATDGHKAFTMQNLNRMLWTYPGATGLKTGRTDNAGGCWLTTATRNGRHLIAVVLNATGYSWEDARILLDYGFSIRPTLDFPIGWFSSPD
ncbi:MAG TPA: D-alanyl-D-alanine carboxypeptidase family protein [Candidatus Dormibacteraeota bacterium]|nr:D-alanyl-D-alanine carboxypeptidase family protein [Candidatus Dormibacteraeota bacterium]